MCEDLEQPALLVKQAVINSCRPASTMNGEFQLLFIGAELLLLNPLWRAMVRVSVYIEKLVAFAIDEAHCITQ